MITAFSRDGPKKVYVQHNLKARAKEINELLEQKAYIYVCGDAANMAREVNTILAQILAEQRGITEAKAEEVVKNMRAANQYQVRANSLRRTARNLGASRSLRSAGYVSRESPSFMSATKLLLTCLAGGCLVVIRLFKAKCSIRSDMIDILA
jgi:hypothetical protein